MCWLQGDSWLPPLCYLFMWWNDEKDFADELLAIRNGDIATTPVNENSAYITRSHCSYYKCIDIYIYISAANLALNTFGKVNILIKQYNSSHHY